MHNQLRAQLDVGTKPFSQQPLNVRQTKVSHDAGSKCDRQDESQHDRAKHHISVDSKKRTASIKIQNFDGTVLAFTQ
jgi:hypothetical protein